METKAVLGRWESRSGKHWVELYRDEFGLGYRAPGAGGHFGLHLTEADAFDIMNDRLASGQFQPDSAKTPMKRVR
jgi:hypothetical protein